MLIAYSILVHLNLSYSKLEDSLVLMNLNMENWKYSSSSKSSKSYIFRKCINSDCTQQDLMPQLESDFEDISYFIDQITNLTKFDFSIEINVQPNTNHYSMQFSKKILSKLHLYNGALLINLKK